MAGNYAKVEELIRKDRRVAIDGIAEHIEITHESAAKTVGSQAMQRFVLGGFPDNLQTPTSKPVLKLVWSFVSVTHLMKLSSSVQ